MSDEIPIDDELVSSELDAPSTPPSADDVMFRVMNFESVLFDLTDSSPHVHLTEAESPYRYLAIPVALPDAIALQHAHSAVEGRRPSSHELMTSMLTRLQAEVIAARVVRHEGGVFYAELDLMTPKGRMTFDCRTSDAFSLALRQSVPAPILVAEDVLRDYYA